MTLADTGPCQPWDPIVCVALPAESAAASGDYVQAATEVLWGLSGRQYGLCEVAVRPCRRDCNDAAAGGWAGWSEWAGGPHPVNLGGGQWMNLVCGGCPGTCSCATISEALLPVPVAAVVQILIDGAVLASGSYRIDDYRTLVRTDGGVWPACNDLARDDDQPGTWSVTLTVGQAVPTAGRLAVGELTAEIARACVGADCRLPAGLTQLVRQGITVSYPDVGTFLDRGLLGLPFCDRFIASSNPARLAHGGRVWSPDVPGWRHTGT